MREVTAALVARILADTRTSTIAAGSTPTTLQLGVGEAASWAKGDLLSLTGAGAELENDGAVAQVESLTANYLVVTPAFAIAPTAGRTIKGGAREWLRYVSATDTGIRYFKGLSADIVAKLFDEDADLRVVLAHGEPSSIPELFERIITEWSLLLMGRDSAWVEGLTRRLIALFHHRHTALTVVGRDVWELVVEANALEERKDALHSRSMLITCSTSRVP